MNLNNTYVAPLGADYTEQWRLSHDVFGGIYELNKNASEYLPKFSNESTSAYNARRKKAVFKPVYKNTITRGAGNLFINGITSNVNEENVDGKGTDLPTFMSEIAVEAFKYGVSYVVVDAPAAPENMTLAEQELLNIRPYFIKLNTRSVSKIHYGFRGSNVILTYFEYEYDLPDNDGKFLKAYSLTPFGVEWKVFKIVNGKEEVHQYGLLPLSTIPVIDIHSQPGDAPFINKPPLYDLARMNILQLNAYSDAAIAHHVHATPMLQIKGAEPKRNSNGSASDANVKVSPWTGLYFPAGTDNGASYVETSGTSLAQHREWLAKIEKDMDEMSLNFHLESPDATATANNIQAVENESNLVYTKKSLESGFKRAYQVARMFDPSIPEAEIEINASGVQSITDSEMADVKDLYEKGLIGDEQYVEIVARRLSFEIKYEKTETEETQVETEVKTEEVSEDTEETNS